MNKSTPEYEFPLTLLIALTKVYDNYITPLNTRIKCWKVKTSDEFFIIGLSILEFDGKYSYLAFQYKLEEWEKFNVMQLNEMPPDFKWPTYEQIIERLLSL